MSDLLDRVLGFVRALREAGIGVSVDEAADALALLPVLPLERRDSVRAALAAALLKEPALRARFDRLFDTYFPMPHVAPTPRAEPGDDASELTAALAARDEERLRELARRRVAEHGDVRPSAQVGEGAFVFRAQRGLNLDAVRDALRSEAVAGVGANALERRAVEEDLAARIARFRELLADEVFAAIVDTLGPDEVANRNRQPPPDEVDFLWASQADLDRMRDAVAPLARALAVRLSRRRRRARRGRLDVRATMRRSLSTGGVLVDPRFRRATAGKPELVLLCDISGSMRAFARFALELTYALATQFQRVRVFVFVDALDEVTNLFDATTDLGAALDRVAAEADVVALDGQSWYGNCLEQFWRRAGRDLAPRTTVVVLGDARTNFRTTGADVLARVRERVHHVWWLNPEPSERWDAGDSEMSAFVPCCTGVYEVRNLRQLSDFVSAVL